jgi:acetyl/propionyl-CoA carboxylase alpha subunit
MLNIFSTVGLKKEDLDKIQFQSIAPDIFEIQTAEKKFIIEILDINIAKKEMKIRHQHSTHLIAFRDELDEVLEGMGIQSAGEAEDSNLTAPMPGRILDVLVETGQEVQKGDGLVVLEAMKMENVLKSEGSFKVSAISVSTDENVEKNQVLIELEAI